MIITKNILGPTTRRRLVWYGLSALAIGLYVVGWNHAPVIPVYPLCATPNWFDPIRDTLDQRYLAAFKRSLIVDVRLNGGQWLDLPGRPLLVSRSYHRSDYVAKGSYKATVDAAEELVGYRLPTARDRFIISRLENSCTHMRSIARGEIPSRHELRWWE